MRLKHVGDNKLSEFATAQEALLDLCEPFTKGGSITADCCEVQPAAMPSAERRLLAHREHMTIVLQDHHGQPVEVQVQEAILDEDQYSRKITLTPGHTNKIVEAGIVRMNFKYMSDAVREAIIVRQRPLGEILIAHDVLRRIEPLWFIRLPIESDVLALFGMITKQPTYGRLATIFCNGEPAIELLETVMNT